MDKRVRVAVRLLDDMIDVSRYPLITQARERAKRGVGPTTSPGSPMR